MNMRVHTRIAIKTKAIGIKMQLMTINLLPQLVGLTKLETSPSGGSLAGVVSELDMIVVENEVIDSDRTSDAMVSTHERSAFMPSRKSQRCCGNWWRKETCRRFPVVIYMVMQKKEY